jgi:hypothetical protein
LESAANMWQKFKIAFNASQTPTRQHLNHEIH